MREVNYIVFAGMCYYGGAGGYACIAVFSDLETATDKAKSVIGRVGVTEEGLDYKTGKPDPNHDLDEPIEWSHVFDVKTGVIVYESERKPYGHQKYIRIKDDD